MPETGYLPGDTFLADETSNSNSDEEHRVQFVPAYDEDGFEQEGHESVPDFVEGSSTETSEMAELRLEYTQRDIPFDLLHRDLRLYYERPYDYTEDDSDHGSRV